VEEGDKRPLYWSEINLGFTCNCRCVFCTSASQLVRKQHPWAQPDALHAEVDRLWASGVNALSFSGGEPTLMPRFEELVGYARDQGFGHIRIISNGLRLADKTRLEGLCDHGLTGVALSLHSPKPALEERITGRTGALPKKLRALDHLAAARDKGRLPDGLSVKAVLHRLLLPLLEQFVRLVQSHGVPDIGFNLIRPNDRPDIQNWVPRFSRLKPRLLSFIAQNEQTLGANLAFMDIPPCQFPWEVLSNPLLRQRYQGTHYERDISLFPAGGHGDAVQTFNWQTQRRDEYKSFAAPCDHCPLRPDCEGIWTHYLDLFGDREFKSAPQTIAHALPQIPRRQ